MNVQVKVFPVTNTSLTRGFMTQQHKHLIVRADISWCPQEEDLNKVSDWIRSLIKKIDMKLLAGPYTTYVNEKGNKGMTSVAIIETSHIALHIWDETNPGLMQLDVYSCADFNPQDIFDKVNELFKTIKIEYKFLDREKELVEVNL
jgi:S-adenosylmethionine/arginine decarboxylase-like enzyme